MMRRLLITLLLCLMGSLSWAASNVLNVYNWSNFMPTDVIQQFEKETGIHVNYMEFDSNETLYAKLKADPNIGFDVIVPSSYYVERMWHENMLRPLDFKQLSNFKNLNPLLLNKRYDPHNLYSLPYAWGTTGIVVNNLYFNPKNFTHWKDLWNPHYKNQLLMLNDMREVFGVGLLALGYSINDRNPQHIEQAYQLLRQLLPNVKLFNSDVEMNIYIDEDAVLGIGWSGDIYLARQENPHVQFIYPQGHFPLWIDCLAVPKNAPHYNNAMRFLNFLMRPDIAKRIAINVGYSSPNAAAVKLLPKEMRADPIFNPSVPLLKRSEVENDVGPANVVYEKYWQLLKLGS